MSRAPEVSTRRDERTGRRRLARGLAALAAAGFVVLTTAAGASADDTTVSHVERTSTGFSVLVDVPAGSQPDLSAVTATVDGEPYDATAQKATSETTVSRTAVIAVDTSDSMSGARIAAAKKAALLFVRTAPANVSIGVVTFDSQVDDALAPTRDRAQAASVINGLQLSKGTRLNDGVLEALSLAGTSGQRSIIIISDGADTNSTATLDQVTAALTGAKVTTDVVGISQSGDALAKLQQIAGEGKLINSSNGALSQAFAKEAAVLQRQVAVSVAVPSSAAASATSIAVDLPTASGSLDASAAIAPFKTDGADATFNPPVISSASAGPDVPEWVKYTGVGVFGVGLLVALAMLAPSKPVKMTAEDRVSTYTVTTRGAATAVAEKQSTEAALDQAKEAVAQVLSRNRGLEQRISRRLDGAGSELKASEWILLHGAIIFVSTVLGLVIFRGNIVLALVFLLLGAVLPWVYLGIKRTRRRKMFNSVLPETLQLISGALSAGLSLSQSVNTIVREGSEPVATEFRRVLVETRLGVPLEDAFDGVASRFESRDFAWVVMAIRIQRQVGGNLGELLDTVAATMREREYMRRQVASLAAEGKLSAYILGLLPPLFLLYLVVTNFTYVKPLFTQPIGLLMLTGGALLLSLGIFWMSRLVKVEV